MIQVSNGDGAPYLQFNDDSVENSTRLCILRGENINLEKGSDLPSIVIGSLALRSLYFSVDYVNGRVGFANKQTHSIHTSNINSTTQCAERKECHSYLYETSIDVANNQCAKGECSNYFFFHIDTDGNCQSDKGALVAGVVILCCIIAMEMASYVVTQYTASQYAISTDMSYSKDSVSIYLGYYVSAFIDKALQEYFSCLDSQDNETE
jgi:hypothetical protein